MTLKEIFSAVKKALSEKTRFAQVDAFSGETEERIKQLCVDEGACVCVSFEGAKVASANASYLIKTQTRDFAIYYACLLSKAGNGEHLDDMEKVLSALHALRVGNNTVQPQEIKLLQRSGVLVYSLTFTI